MQEVQKEQSLFLAGDGETKQLHLNNMLVAMEFVVAAATTPHTHTHTRPRL